MIVTKHDRPELADLLPVIHTGELTPNQKLVWLYLAAVGGAVVPYSKGALYDRIATNTNIGWETAKRSLVKLKALDLVQWCPNETRAFAIAREDGD